MSAADEAPIRAMCRLTGVPAPDDRARPPERVAAELARALAVPAGPRGQRLGGRRLSRNEITAETLLEHVRDVVLLAAWTQRLKATPATDELAAAARARVDAEQAWLAQPAAPQEAIQVARERLLAGAIRLSEEREGQARARRSGPASQEQTAPPGVRPAVVDEHEALTYAALIARVTNKALGAMAVGTGGSTLAAIRRSGPAKFARGAERLEQVFARALVDDPNPAGGAPPMSAPPSENGIRNRRLGPVPVAYALTAVAAALGILAMLALTGVFTNSPSPSGGVPPCGPGVAQPDPRDARARATRPTRTPRALDPIVIGSGPAALAIGYEGLWVGATDGISLIDPETSQKSGAVSRVTSKDPSLDNAPFSIALSRDRLWISRRDGRLVSLDRENLKRTGPEVQYGAAPAVVALANGYVWVNHYRDRHDGELSRIHPCTGEIRRFGPIGRGANTVYSAFGSLWVTDSVSAALHRVDPTSGRRVATIKKLADPQDVFGAFGRLWVNEWGGWLRAIDPRTNQVVGRRLRTGPGPAGLTADAESLWIPLLEEAELLRVDPRRGVTRRLEADGLLTDVEVGFGRVWTPDNDGDSVLVFGL